MTPWLNIADALAPPPAAPPAAPAADASFIACALASAA